MSVRTFSIAAALLLGWASSSAAQSVKLEFGNGRVNLTTQNATARAILAEWARLGGTRIVNGDRVAGPPLTLELMGVSERQALDVILRGVSGYMIASRETAGSGASNFDRIMILPASTAPRVSATPAPLPQPMVSRPQPNPRDDALIDLDTDADEPQADRQFPGTARERLIRPVLPNVNGTPQPVEAEPNTGSDPQGRPAPNPGNPFGVLPGSARPGVITPPQQPNNREPNADADR